MSRGRLIAVFGVLLGVALFAAMALFGVLIILTNLPIGLILQKEIPGEEAFPAYLESYIAAFYERAGIVRMRDGAVARHESGGHHIA